MNAVGTSVRDHYQGAVQSILLLIELAGTNRGPLGRDLAGGGQGLFQAMERVTGLPLTTEEYVQLRNMAAEVSPRGCWSHDRRDDRRYVKIAFT